MTCDVKWKSLATKVEREVAVHDTNDLGSDARRMPHAAWVPLSPSGQHSIDARVARALDIAIVSTD